MSPRPRTEPERTCVGCRTVGAKRDLLRFVKGSDGTIRVDRTGEAPGRGAYVHREERCVAGGVRRGGLARALRTGLDPAQAARLMDEAMEAVRETA